MRNRLTNLGAIVFGVGTFFVIDALDELIKVGIGCAIGWMAGLAVFVKWNERHQERRTANLRDRPLPELIEEARRLQIEGRSEMNKEQLARAISAAYDEPDEAAQAMKETLDGASRHINRVVGRRRPRRTRP
jgi:uncharacterized membrane protein YccC